MYKLRRKFLSQNFLHDHELITKLVRNSSIGKKDLVLEIGPGKGIITEQLIKQAQSVQAVEIDRYWFKYLQNKLRTAKNLTLYNQDFLNFHISASPYKVFANIPFSIEGRTIRKLIEAKNPPEDCYLVVRKEFASRIMKTNSLFFTKHTPWFQLSTVYYFKKFDFSPKPKVSAVLLKVSKRRHPFLPWSEKAKYQSFVENGFGQGLSVIFNLRGDFDNQTLLKAAHQISLSKNTKPGRLNLNQWLRLYSDLKESFG